jgi:transposase
MVTCAFFRPCWTEGGSAYHTSFALSVYCSPRYKGIVHPRDEGLGRSRGGLTTKFHLACDGKGRPLSVVITAGQRHDSTQLVAVLEGIRVPRPGGRGRPRTRPDHVIADKGYSYGRCRRWLRRHQIPHTIPERRDQRARRATQPGRPLAFDQAIYARRNVVERCINRLKQWRGLATRYEKRAVNYRAMVVLASIVLWLES